MLFSKYDDNEPYSEMRQYPEELGEQGAQEPPRNLAGKEVEPIRHSLRGGLDTAEEPIGPRLSVSQ